MMSSNTNHFIDVASVVQMRIFNGLRTVLARKRFTDEMHVWRYATVSALPSRRRDLCSHGARWLIPLVAFACDSTTAPATSALVAAGGSSGGANSAGGQMPAGTGGAQGNGGASAAGTANAGGAAGVPVSYTTNFDVTESPISEGGKWMHLGQDWTFVGTSGGNAYGLQALSPRSGPNEFNDSYAYLTGFSPDQSVSVTLHLISAIDRTTSHEVEILLRWADAAHNARGYECNLSYNGAYAEIVRWNGALGDYTYVTAQGSGGPGSVRDGDVFTAQIVGNTITTSLNGKRLATATDATFTTGNPGMGFFRGSNGAGSLGDYGFSSFTATAVAH